MRKKSLLALTLATAMAAGVLAGCGNKNETTTAAPENNSEVASSEATGDAEEKNVDSSAYDGKKVKVWVANEIVGFTEKQIADFQEKNPQYKGVTFTVEAVGEGDAASNVITDVKAAADIYGFAQDQLTRLVTAGALEEVNPDYKEAVLSANDDGAVKAGTVGDVMYAYPITSDNGYFLYYDKSVVKDPSTLEGIVKDCEAAGKNFYFEINSGWYQTAFFFGTGCTLTYDTDKEGNFTGCNADYASDKGMVALKKMIELKSSSSFQNGSSLSNATNVGAIVDGAWDSSAAKELFGDNYATAKLPTFQGSDGKTYQLSGFSGNKLLGVKPQEDTDKLQICDDLAYYLSSEEVQLARFDEVGWGPSNKNAQANEKVASDEALKALGEQVAFDIPQGQYPDEYWKLATGLGDSIISDTLTANTSDDDLLKALTDFQNTCKSYAGQ